uniref:Uncharacterized protein n=1 Tax=Pavo cristatus TaxID=9049 RepID=A0A8C9F9B4_PAVCR
VAYRRDEMWSEGRYDYERLPRERLPPRFHPDDESGYRWPRDDHPMNRQTEYRYYIKLHSNAMDRKVWRLSVPTSFSKQLLLQQKD